MSAFLGNNNVIDGARRVARLGVEALLAPTRHPTREVRWLAWLGWALVGTGLFHAAVWAWQGMPELSGAVGWRKPIVFGLSGGVTSLSVAALAQAVGARSQGWLRLYGVTMLLEVALIDLQAWRGVGSHFNTATPFDSAVFSVMGALILTAMVAACAVGVRAARAAQTRDAGLAAQLATLSLVVGTAVGIAMSVHGSVAVASGGVPSRMGAGEWKPVHGLAIHGLQLFPLLGWALRVRVSDVARRVRGLGLAATAWGLLLAASLVQLLLRRAPTDPAPLPLTLGVAAAVVAALALGVFFPPRAARVSKVATP